MTKQASTTVLAIIISLSLIGNFISPSIVLGQRSPNAAPKGSSAGGRGEAARQLGETLGELGVEKLKEKQKRRQYIKEYIQRAATEHPNDNVVISHKGGQVSGDNVTHEHYELEVGTGTVGYEIYFSPKGKPFTFARHGDGGDENWGYNSDEVMRINGNTVRAKVH